MGLVDRLFGAEYMFEIDDFELVSSKMVQINIPIYNIINDAALYTNPVTFIPTQTKVYEVGISGRIKADSQTYDFNMNYMIPDNAAGLEDEIETISIILGYAGLQFPFRMRLKPEQIAELTPAELGEQLPDCLYGKITSEVRKQRRWELFWNDYHKRKGK